jgi:formylglycine-generating enzyme required for sulfatase activity
MKHVVILAVISVTLLPLALSTREPSVSEEPDRTLVRVEPVDGPAFLMARRETSVAEYAEFVAWIALTGDHSRCDPDEEPGRDHRPRGVRVGFLSDPGGPVVGVDWFDAAAYAAWRGGRLPTRREWLRAAQASGLAPGAWDLEAGTPIRGIGRDLPRVPGTAVARIVQVALGGCLGLADGVSEWCAAASAATSAGAGRQREPVLGGNWYLNARAALATAWRSRSYRHSTVGFRYVVDIPGQADRSGSVGIVLQEDPKAGR